MKTARQIRKTLAGFLAAVLALVWGQASLRSL